MHTLKLAKWLGIGSECTTVHALRVVHIVHRMIVYISIIYTDENHMKYFVTELINIA